MIGELPSLHLYRRLVASSNRARPPARRVSAEDVAAVLSTSAWAMSPGALATLHATLPAMVGLTVDAARQALGAAQRSGPSAAAGAVAVLPVLGTIWPRGGFADLLGLTTPERVAARLATLVADPDVSAIVLDLHSPGGAVSGVPELASVIMKARANKRIVAVANHLAASGAYWIAAAAGELVITPSGEVGSIGVYTVHQDHSRALEQEGVKVSLVSAGKFKTEGNPYEPLGDEARAAIQSRVNDYYGMFTQAVATGRGVRAADVRAGFGQGRAVGAKEAVRLGMADRIGTLQAVITGLLKPRPASSSAAVGRAGPSPALDMRRRRTRLQEFAIDADREKLLLAERRRASLPADLVAAADRALAWCLSDLGMNSLPLAYFDSSYAPLVRGFYQSGEIWLNAGVLFDTRVELLTTIAHEARHYWQASAWPAAQFSDERQSEQDAQAYAARALHLLR